LCIASKRRDRVGLCTEIGAHNAEYAPVPLGHRSEWFLVGTITKIVEAPLPRR